MNNILKNYVCLNPFNYLEIHNEKVYCCCPSWLPTPVGETNKLDEIWKGDTLKAIQESILDGSYSFCDKTLCPYISELYYNDISIGIFDKKEQFKRELHDKGPGRISLCFDNSCNLACPSCRKDFMMAGSKELETIEKTMDDVSKNFGSTASYISMSGTADAFASKTFRKLLINFDYEKFPKVTGIYLQTNGILLNEEMWNKIEKSQKLIRTIGISIDASTKETYEIVRRGGDWDILMENIKFISQLDKIKDFSFVVQDTNYMEMESFYNLITSLKPKGTYKIYFSKISNWNTYTKDEFKVKEIFNENHPEFELFLKELSKVAFKYNVVTNMNDIIQKFSLKPKTNKLI